MTPKKQTISFFPGTRAFDVNQSQVVNPKQIYIQATPMTQVV